MATDSGQQAYGSPPAQTSSWGPYGQPAARPEGDAARAVVAVDEPFENGEDDSAEDGDDKDGSRKRKRPMSVSCELCKQRKVKCKCFASLAPSSRRVTQRMQAIAGSPRVVGARATVRSASIESARSLVFGQVRGLHLGH